MSLVLTVDCEPRSANEAFACFYVAHYAGASTKALLGSGIQVSKTADQAAAALVASTQDVVERWNNNANERYRRT